MKQDECYNFLQVKDTMYANTIRAKKLVLDDETLESNIHMAGERVKTLYESQKDTNCYNDGHKSTVASLQESGILHNSKVYTPIYTDEETQDIPTNSMCLCLYNGDLVFKVNANNTIKYIHPTCTHERVKVDIRAKSQTDEVETVLQTVID